MLPIDPDFLIEAIRQSTCSVFEMMLNLALEPGKPGMDSAEIDGGIVALVGLTGAWSGTGSLSCSPGTATSLYTRMLSMDERDGPAAVTDDVMDALAELTNMAIGNVKHILEERVGPMAINLPMVIYGRNFQFKRPTGMTGISIPFAFDGGSVEIRLVLAPIPEQSSFLRARAESLILLRANSPQSAAC